MAENKGSIGKLQELLQRATSTPEGATLFERVKKAGELAKAEGGKLDDYLNDPRVKKVVVTKVFPRAPKEN